MTYDRTDKIFSAIGGIETAYLEEALAFEPKANGLRSKRKRARRLPGLSAACAALLIVSGLSATAFAMSRMPVSWRDIFGLGQSAIDGDDEVPVVSEQNPDGDPAATSGPGAEDLPDDTGQSASAEHMEIEVVKAISDERVLYLLYSMKAGEGAVLDPDGRFASFEMYFPGKMMSGAYQQYSIERVDGVPENELEGVIYADWQAGAKAKELVLRFSDWQEKKMFDDARVDFNVAETAANAGENAELPVLYNRDEPQYLWQPGDSDIKLPYGGVSICNAGWEDGMLQMVMKGPNDPGEWSTGENWHFVDTRTGEIIRPELRACYHAPGELDAGLKGADWLYFWNFVYVGKDALPYLQMHCGGKESFDTVLAGEWEVGIDETPVTVESRLLAEDVRLSRSGKELLAGKIECSKLSLAVYFADYVDPTTGILDMFKVFDANGDPISCDFGFTADVESDGCMIWTRFEEPIDPENVYRLTFNGDTIFEK